MLVSIIGLRRSGKTTYAAKIAKKYQKKGIPVYCNFPCDGCLLIDSRDIGFYDISDGCLIIDEAGIDFNSRMYKGMSKEFIQWIKLSGHYGVNDIYVLSQAFDFDITIRRLSDKMYLMKKAGYLFSYLRPITPYDAIDNDGQPVIKWQLFPIPTKIFYRPKYYKYFDSFAADPLPHKDFQVFNSVYTTKSFKDRLSSLKSSISAFYKAIKGEIVENRLIKERLAIDEEKEYVELSALESAIRSKSE